MRSNLFSSSTAQVTPMPSILSWFHKGQLQHTLLVSTALAEPYNTSPAIEWAFGHAAQLRHAILQALEPPEAGAAGKGRATRLRDCHSDDVLCVSLTDGRVSTYGHRCRQNVCPACRAHRINRATNTWWRANTRAGFVYFLTFTLVKRGSSIRVANQRIVDAFKKLRRARYWSRVHSGIGVFDLTWAPNGPHVHLHVLVAAQSPLETLPLHHAWCRAVGLGKAAAHVHIQPCDRTSADGCRLSAYLSEPPLTLAFAPLATVREWCQVIYRRQSIVTFGAHKPTSKTKPKVAIENTHRLLLQKPVMPVATALSARDAGDSYATRLLLRVTRPGLDRRYSKLQSAGASSIATPDLDASETCDTLSEVGTSS